MCKTRLSGSRWSTRLPCESLPDGMPPSRHIHRVSIMGSAISRASDLSPEFVLLGLLAEGPSYGYELHLRIKTEFQNIWALSQSQCYAILKRLEAQGALKGEVIQQEQAPSRRSLRLTQAGGASNFQVWLSSRTPGGIRAIRVSFLTRLFFALQESEALAVNIIEDRKKRPGTPWSDLKRRWSSLLHPRSSISFRFNFAFDSSAHASNGWMIV